MILYSEDTSPYSAPVRAAIYAKHLAIPIEEPPGGRASDEYRALSRTGTIPCLVLDDGSPIPESAVIIGYLDDKFPERPLRPADPEGRARMGVVMRLAESGVVVPIVQLFHELTEGVAGASGRALESLEQGLGRLTPFIADDGYAVGPDFTEADCLLGPALFGVKAFAPMLGDAGLLVRFAKLAAYDHRVAEHPAIAKVLGELHAALSASRAG
jgi:glutathione S-transferase